MLADFFKRPVVRLLIVALLVCGGLLPYVIIASTSPVTATTAEVSGTITDTGGSPSTTRGFVYGKTLSYGATTTENGSFSAGSFSEVLTGLMCATTYHYAAYAINEKGVGYGADDMFTTSACPSNSAPPEQQATTTEEAATPSATSTPQSTTTPQQAATTTQESLVTPPPSSVTAPEGTAPSPSQDTQSQGGSGLGSGSGGGGASGGESTTGDTLATDSTGAPAPVVKTTLLPRQISPQILATAGAVGVVMVGYAGYASSVNRFLIDIVLSLLGWLASFGAAKALRKKKIGVIGTHNAYVLAGDALDEGVVVRVYELKGGAPVTPYPILISSREELKKFGVELTPRQEEALVKKFWPGPVSVMLSCTHSKFEYLHRGTETLVFRFPADFLTLSLLRKSGPLIAPTANPEGHPVATTVTEAKRYFKHGVSFFINKGKLPGLTPTLIQLSSEGEITVLYQGEEQAL